MAKVNVAAAAKKLAKSAKKEAEDILAKIDTPEKALALKGAEREQYLKALDATYGDKAVRAKDLGFDEDKIRYHGTNKTIDKFQPNMQGTGMGRSHSKPASFFTNNYELADSYANSLVNRHGGEKNIIPVLINNEEMLVNRIQGMPLSKYEIDNSLDKANNLNRTGVRFVDAVDSPGYDKIRSDITAVTDPAKIRSTNAAFDPRFKDSPYLLSANSRTPASSGNNTAQKVLDAARNSAQTPVQSGNQEASMFETVGRKALPYIAPALQKAAPVLEAASPVLSVLNKPQELATSAADKLTGGTGEAQSFADIGSRLNQKLPESMQNEGLMRDIGYAADIAFPSPKIDKIAKMANPAVQKMAKEISKAALQSGDISIVNNAAKLSANNVQKSLAGLDGAFSREIPMSRKTVATDRASHALLGPGNTVILKGGQEIQPLISGPTVGKTVSVNSPGVKIIQGDSSIKPQGIKPANNRQSAAVVLQRMAEEAAKKGK